MTILTFQFTKLMGLRAGFYPHALSLGEIASIRVQKMGFGAMAPAGSRGRAPGQRVWGGSHQKLEVFSRVSIADFLCTGSYCGNTASLLYVCNDDRNCMNCTDTVLKTIKSGSSLHLCHNTGKFRSIFRILALFKQEEIF